MLASNMAAPFSQPAVQSLRRSEKSKFSVDFVLHRMRCSVTTEPIAGIFVFNRLARKRSKTSALSLLLAGESFLFSPYR
ncbi:uncharacterized protein G2W53_010385 [Senna tora]|uniref:Uncharacterized protein n=1 Tax=Senna tora TaxID=362788 RepID=A0A835C9B6_9FABA|nr:uncharacterized protein G2W53_010385 [Senna tora]